MFYVELVLIANGSDWSAVSVESCILSVKRDTSDVVMISPSPSLSFERICPTLLWSQSVVG